MSAIIRVVFWDECENEIKTEYIGLSNCSSFVDAARYAEDYYGDTIEELEIVIRDTPLYTTEETFKAFKKRTI